MRTKRRQRRVTHKGSKASKRKRKRKRKKRHDTIWHARVRVLSQEGQDREERDLMSRYKRDNDMRVENKANQGEIERERDKVITSTDRM